MAFFPRLSSPVEQKFGRQALRVFVAGILACTALHAVRAYWALQCSAHAPGTAATSGFEWESLFAVFREVHGAPVFTNPAYSPFCSSYFNWLFYLSNGIVAKPLVAIFGDTAIPFAGRLFNFAGSIAGVFALGLLWEALRRDSQRTPRVVGWMLALFWGTGPLIGWWAFTLRPDVWAAALEAYGLVWIAMRRTSRFGWRALPAALAFFCAWSFKQTAVSGVVAATLFLLLEKDLRALMALVFGYTFAILLVFDLASPGYLAAFADLVSNNRYDSGVFHANLAGFLAKTAPLLVGVACWSLPVMRRDSAPPAPGAAHRVLRLGAIATVVSVILTLILTSKVGASTNYYFPVATALTLLAFGLIALRPPSTLSLVASGTTALVIAGALIFGKAGSVSMAPQLRNLDARLSVFNRLEQPRWSSDPRLDLPWINLHSPTYILAYNYETDRTAGLSFERGGIGGVIERGELKSLMLPAGTGDTFDGHSLRRYRRVATLAGLSVFVLKH